MPEQVLRLFVSSPGDVADERRRVEIVVERLNAEFKGRAQIKAVRWETEFYSAHDTFQKQIPEAAECDVVVAIFRARLGTELPQDFPRLPTGEPYPSGTAYEVLSAITARKGGKEFPDIYVFRYPRPPSIELDNPEEALIRTQWERLKSFFDTWFRTSGGQFLAAFQDFGSTDDFAKKLEDCLRQWLVKRGFVAEGVIWDRVLDGSPFPGLGAFDARHERVFFGRELATAHAAARLREAGARGAPFLLVIGASGSGKSSFLRAGLMPHLVRPGTIPEIDLWRNAIMVAGPDPLLALAEALLADNALGPELRRSSFAEAKALASVLSASAEAAIAPVRTALERAAKGRAAEEKFEELRPTRLAIAIDQAERLFLEASPGAAHGFAAVVDALVRNGLAYAVMALRSDAYPRFQLDATWRDLREAGATFDLVPPAAGELEEIVTQPVAACRPPLAFEMREGRSLASILVEEAKGGDVLALLQMTLSRLFDAEKERGDGALRFTDYPGISAAVTKTAEEALAMLGADGRAEVPALVTALVRDVTSDPLSGAQMPVIGALDRAAFAKDRPARAALVDAFVARRLLTSEGAAGASLVRPAHEALLRIWPEAVGIIAENAALIRVRHTLEPLVRGWREAPDAERDRHLAIPAPLLAGAQQMLGRFGDDLPSPMRDFVTRALAADAARRDQERRRQRKVIAAMLAALVVVTSLAAAAVAAGLYARNRQVAAQASLFVARSQADLRDRRPASAVRNAASAFAELPSSETRSALLSALREVSPNLAGGYDIPGDTGQALAWPDDDTIAVALASGRVSYFTAAGHPVTAADAKWKTHLLPDAPEAAKIIRGLRLASDGRLLAVLDHGVVEALPAGGAASVLFAPSPPAELDPGAGSGVSIGRSGTVIAMATIDAGVLLLRCDWRAAPSGSPACTGRSVPTERARAVDISPDGARLAVGDDAGRVTIYDIASLSADASFEIGGPVISLGFAPERDWLAAGTRSGTIAVLDVAKGSEVARKVYEGAPVPALAWSGSSLDLAFSCGGTRICLWGFAPKGEEAGAKPALSLADHAGTIRRLGWAPDGKRFASLSTSGELRIWAREQDKDAGFELVAPASGSLSFVAASPDGKSIAAGGDDGELYLWENGSGPALTAGTRGQAEIGFLAWRGDGLLAGAHADGTLTLWRTNRPDAAATLTLSAGGLGPIAFIGQSETIAAVLPDDGRVALFDISGAGERKPAFLDRAGTDTTLRGVAALPDGKALAASYTDGDIRLWDLATRKITATLPSKSVEAARKAGTQSLSATPDGHWLAAAGGDVFVTLHNLADKAKSFTLQLDGSAPLSVAFDATGRKLAALSASGNVQVWDFADGVATLLAGFGAIPDRSPGKDSELATWLAWTKDGDLAIATSAGMLRVVRFDEAAWQRRIDRLDYRAPASSN